MVRKSWIFLAGRGRSSLGASSRAKHGFRFETGERSVWATKTVKRLMLLIGGVIFLGLVGLRLLYLGPFGIRPGRRYLPIGFITYQWNRVLCHRTPQDFRRCPFPKAI